MQNQAVIRNNKLKKKIIKLKKAKLKRNKIKKKTKMLW